MLFNTIEHLRWDSDLFGYTVARIVFDKQGGDKLGSIFKQISSKIIHLTYLFVPIEEEDLNKCIANKGCILVDQKTFFCKATEKNLEYNHKIFDFTETKPNDNLIELVLESGLFSRFKVDKNFVNREYERLYTEWLRKSLDKTIAIKTFIVKDGPETIGLTTLCRNSETADIGLVAVTEKKRGLGIASDLIRYADNSAYDLGFKIIKVVTQLQNKSACRLYERCNFKIENIINVYHYWC